MYSQTAVAAAVPRNRFLITDNQIEENRETYTMGFDIKYAELFCEKILNPIREVWYRAKFIGFENFPLRNNPDSPLIFATNHSGMAFPWDAIAFISRGIEKLKDSAQSIRALISPMLTKFPNMCPYMIDGLWWKAGCINATFLNFETGMKLNKSNILIFPEGIEGIGKGFDKKYQFQPFKTSFLRMSIRYKTDIIPFYTINGEYTRTQMMKTNVEVKKKTAVITAAIESGISGVRTAKAFANEREEMMPMQKAYPIAGVVDLLKQYNWYGQRRISFEYTMFKGINDDLSHAAELVRLVKGLRCRVNLIRFHASPETPYKTSDEHTMTVFRDYLDSHGVTCTIRASRGEDIMAACGLLAGKQQEERL